MTNPDPDDKIRQRHMRITSPSPWVERFAPLVPGGGAVLDIAAGGGRHTGFFSRRGHPVTAIDRNLEGLLAVKELAGVTVHEWDLEDGPSAFMGNGPLAGQTFAGIVVVNYLHRPLMELLLAALAPGGVLIYETFARGNEVFTRPRNPDHLLKSGELLNFAAGRLNVVAYEHGVVEAAEIPGVKQRLCAVNDLGAGGREDGDPPVHDVIPN